MTSFIMVDKIIGCLYFFVCVVGTIFNALMLAVSIDKLIKKKFNPTSLILLQLCFVDFVACALQAPVVCYALLNERSYDLDGDTYVRFCDTFGFLSNLIPMLSIYLTTSLCFVRFVGVRYVFSSRRIMTLDKVFLICVGCWGIPILIACIPFFDNTHYTYSELVGAFYMRIREAGIPKSLHLFIKVILNLCIMVPFIVTIYCCIIVIRKLRESTEEQDSPTSLASGTQSKRSLSGWSLKLFKKEISLELSVRSQQLLSSEETAVKVRVAERQRTISHMQHTDSSIRASVTIMVITVAFIVAYGPYICLFIFNFIVFELGIFADLVDTESESFVIYLYVYFLATNMMSTVNSCIFPIIYFLRIKRTRIMGTLKALLQNSVRNSCDDNDYHYHKLNLMKHHHSV